MDSLDLSIRTGYKRSEFQYIRHAHRPRSISSIKTGRRHLGGGESLAPGLRRRYKSWLLFASNLNSHVDPAVLSQLYIFMSG